jgi:serine protease Do
MDVANSVVLAALLASAPPLTAAMVPGAPGAAAQPAPVAAGGPFCAGEYAQDLSALQPRARQLEERQPSYTFAIRSTAVYECPYYGADGDLRRVRKRVVAHGTAFAYRQQQDGTLLVTNHHVAEWPLATDDDHGVEGVPAGCRRVSVSLKLVDGVDDDYEADDVPVTRVVSDPQLDIAIVKARATLPVLPWKVGRSAALRERDVVNVRGFPLGALQADNVGKVVSALDHDSFRDWDHDDFVVDALLSPGNSGSPVLAVSCKTGEFELVGVFHAAYAGGSALNVVVAVDQLRDLLTTLRRAPHPRGVASTPQAKARTTLELAVASAGDPFFPFGSLVTAVRRVADGRLWYEVFSPDYPLESWPVLVLEDLPGASPDDPGQLGRAWIGNHLGLKPFERRDLDAEALGQLSRVFDALRSRALTTFQYRVAEAGSRASRERHDEAQRLERALRKGVADDRYLDQLVLDLSDRLGPGAGDRTVDFAAALQAATPSPPRRPAEVDVAAAPAGAASR